MSDQQHPEGQIIEGHEYDGIRELNNPLPRWWLITFYATIIFGFAYYLHYEVLKTGPSSSEELRQDMAAIQSQTPNQSPTPAQSPSIDFAALIADPSAIDAGKAEYLAKCAACHGPAGGGLIGPNLVDNSWIHGSGKGDEILLVVKAGVPDKGMPAWDGLIAAEVMPKVVAYVMSLKGTNPPGAKAAEGTAVTE